jgi:hypothetical protein
MDQKEKKGGNVSNYTQVHTTEATLHATLSHAIGVSIKGRRWLSFDV